LTKEKSFVFICRQIQITPQRMKNRLQKSLEKVEKYPSFLQSFLIDYALGNAIKYVGTSGIHFEKITPNEVITSIQNRKKVQNHFGQVHAVSMILLAETATGIVVGMSIPDNKIPLIKTLRTDFVRRSQGAIRAVASLTDEQIDMIKTQDKGETYVSVVVKDETGVENIKCEMLWAWTLKKS
jgi:acyl-coenzyme A thioesterase PaaI-like protein